MGSCPARQTKRNFDARLFDSDLFPEKRFSGLPTFHVFLTFVIFVEIDFYKNAPEVSGRCLGPPPTYQGPILDHFGPKLPIKLYQDNAYKNPIKNLIKSMKRRQAGKPIFLRQNENQKDAHRNSAHNDVPDSSPSFILAPFVTKT